jgi:hypothetical protein
MSDDGEGDCEETKVNIKKKPGPGRPRKKPLRPAAPRNGISATAKKDDNCMEFVYSQPVIFKKVFSLFKSSGSSELNIIFDMTEVRVLATDHPQKSDILIIFNASMLTHYYCAARMLITVKAEEIDDIIQVIDKDSTIVNMIVKKTNARSSFIILLQNEMELDLDFDVKLISSTIEHSFHLSDFDWSTHAIGFEMISKDFKKLISNIERMSDAVTIKKVGATGMLTFSYWNDLKTVKANIVARKPENIKLKSSVAGDDIFLTTAKIVYIKPYSSAVLAEQITVHVDGTKKMLLVSELDDKCITVKVAVTIEGPE